MELQIISKGESVTLGSVGNTLISYWSGDVIQKELDRMIENFQQFSNAHSQFLLFSINSKNAQPPSSSQQKQLLASINGITNLTHLVVWLDAEGFVAAVKRSVFSTMALLNRSPVDFRVFAQAEPACEWLIKHGAPENLLSLSQGLDVLKG